MLRNHKSHLMREWIIHSNKSNAGFRLFKYIETKLFPFSFLTSIDCKLKGSSDLGVELPLLTLGPLILKVHKD